MYVITWITATGGVKRESFATVQQASKRLRFLQVHGNSATLEVR